MDSAPKPNCDLGEEPVVAAWDHWADRTPGLPKDTLRGLIARGGGPISFILGKRRFITREAWHAWLTAAEQRGGFHVGRTATSPPRPPRPEGEASRPRRPEPGPGEPPRRPRGRPRKHRAAETSPATT
jgi:hypothetical protein